MVGFGEILGQMFGSLAGAENGVHVKIWNELKPWFGTLVPAATRKWLPNVAAGIACEIPDGAYECDHHAVACCDVCHRPTCLNHGRIDKVGDLICYECVADAMQLVPTARRARAAERPPAAKKQARQPPPRARQQEQEQAPPPRQGKPPPTAREVAYAYNMLGLMVGAPMKEIAAAHRKLSARHHPDKARGADAKEIAERRFKEVQAALDVLKRAHAARES